MVHTSLGTIPNRYAFLDLVKKAVDADSDISVMLVDVVRFSDVSSSFGYQAGDQILLEIANRIARIFANKAVLGRISGDVFGLVLRRHDDAQLRGLYNHLVEHFKTPISLGDHSFLADFNVGAVSNPAQNRDANKLLARVEAALKQAKENKYENFHSISMTEKAVTGRALALKADLERALAQHELELFFQPKVALDDLKVVGAECLLRWNHPLDGVLFPGALIEAAESYNMMNQVGYWVVEQAVKTAAEFARIGLDIKLSVNISPTQLYDVDFIQRLRQLGMAHALDLRGLQLELTEDVALSNSLMVKRQLSEARALGLSIAVDDFGKGYSNLAYIRDLSLDTIKIDKTFVMGLTDQPVNRAIIEATQLIAKSLHCEVVAEGIESMQHLHICREIGINIGQGFLFAKAMPLQEFIRFAQTDICVGTSPAFQGRRA